MALLTKDEISSLVNKGGSDQIFIDPLLSDDQIGAVSIDLRLGVDFLVSVQTRSPSVRLFGESAAPDLFYQPTRRDIGDSFLVHPNQTVLANTLEYIGLPNDLYADMKVRSSYQRLGVAISSHFQPGFRGCASLELFNHSNVPVELIVGSRLVQARFFRTSKPQSYINDGTPRKYLGNVRPTSSRAQSDADLVRLRALSRST